jgi:Tol biopolymer transport system component
MISPVLTGYSGVAPIWSPDGKQIAFVMNDGTKLGKRLDELRSNVYVADVSSGDVRQLTRYSRVQVLAPIWSPDGSMLAFIGNPDGVPGQLELWAMNTDGRAVHRIDESRGLTVNTNATNVAVVWLP